MRSDDIVIVTATAIESEIAAGVATHTVTEIVP
jgi:hypothetical protein